MSLLKAIKHGKEHRSMFCHSGCNCDRCRRNLLSRYVIQVPIHEDGTVESNDRTVHKYKAMKMELPEIIKYNLGKEIK